jgi:hypothetical protein
MAESSDSEDSAIEVTSDCLPSGLKWGTFGTSTRGIANEPFGVTGNGGELPETCGKFGTNLCSEASCGKLGTNLCSKVFVFWKLSV